MSIADAVKKNAAPLAQAQTEYRERVVIINSYMNQVLSTKIPPLNKPPSNWAQFLSVHEAADAHALVWVEDVMAHLESVPVTVGDYNTLIVNYLTVAASRAAALVADPSDHAALQALELNLNEAAKEIGSVKLAVDGVIKQLQGFQNNMPTLASELEALAHEAIADSGVDERKVNDLSSEVDSLRHEVKSLEAQLIGLGVGEGLIFTLGIAATWALWPAGAAVWFVLGPLMLVGGYAISLDEDKLKNTKEKIEAKQAEMTEIEADVSALKLLSTHYSSMVQEAATIEEKLSKVLEAWEALEADVDMAVSETSAGLAGAQSQAFKQAEEDINKAAAEWKAADEAAGDLAFTITVNTAMVEVGMSEKEIKDALAGGETKDMIAYFREVGAVAA